MLAVALTVSIGACSGSTDGPAPEPTTTIDLSRPPITDRQAVVDEIVDQVIAPSVRDADVAVAAARDAVVEHCADPTAPSAEAALAAVSAGLDAYERLDLVDMGPIHLNRTDSHVSYPVDGPRVDELVADGPPTDPLTVNENLPASTRGLTAAEHLLTVEVEGAAHPNACGFLVAITTDAATEVAAVARDTFEGSRGNPAYVLQLTGNANVAEDPSDTVNVVANMVLTVLEQDAMVLGDPEESTPTARRAAAAHLTTLAGLWGDGATGLSRLAPGELAARLADEIERASMVVADGGAPASDAQLAIDEVRATFGTEVVAALDVIIGFSDNDGDS